jgi:hypothetical protein
MVGVATGVCVGAGVFAARNGSPSVIRPEQAHASAHNNTSDLEKLTT